MTAVFDALLAIISADKVTILVVEDAHWADEATLDAIRFLGRRVRERRCLLILTTRRQDSGTRRSLTHILSALPTGRRAIHQPRAAIAGCRGGVGGVARSLS